MNGHGGARAGAGRKRKPDCRQMTVRIRREYADKIPKGHASDLLNSLLEEHFKGAD